MQFYLLKSDIKNGKDISYSIFKNLLFSGNI